MRQNLLLPFAQLHPNSLDAVIIFSCFSRSRPSRHLLPSRARQRWSAAACIPARYLYYYFYFCLVEYGAKSKLTPITSQPPSLGTKKLWVLSRGSNFHVLFCHAAAARSLLFFCSTLGARAGTQGVLGFGEDFSGSLATYDSRRRGGTLCRVDLYSPGVHSFSAQAGILRNCNSIRINP